MWNKKENDVLSVVLSMMKPLFIYFFFLSKPASMFSMMVLTNQSSLGFFKNTPFSFDHFSNLIYFYFNERTLSSIILIFLKISTKLLSKASN